MPGIPKAEVKSRIILTPEHAKRLLLALGENMSKFETVHGTVKVDDRGPGFAPLGYN
jgi:predicted class III extradiol MEMO1 family dioxygenase